MGDILTMFPLFAGMNKEQLHTIANELDAPFTFNRGDSIYRSDTFRRAIGLIVSGSVTVHTPEDGNHSLMMNRLGAGCMFGVAALYDSSDTYVTHIVAEEKTSILFLSQETVSSLLVKFPLLAENYIRFLSGRIRFLNRKLAVVTTGGAEHRLYQYLLTHQDERGTVTLPPSMVELAHTLNIGRSSLYRALDALLDAGVLEREDRQYRLIK